MAILKQIKNDISYFMWVIGITGWLKAIKNVFPYERHAGPRDGCTRCATLDDPQADAYREPAG